MPIEIYQLVSTIAWLVTVALLAPSFCRVLFADHSRSDEWRAALFVAALLFAGFAGRWLFAPEQAMVRELLYVLSTCLAVYVWLLLWNRRAQ